MLLNYDFLVFDPLWNEHRFEVIIYVIENLLDISLV